MDDLGQVLSQIRQDAPAQAADGTPLSEILEGLLLKIEAASRGDFLASILLLDESGERLMHGAAPSLPRAYCQAIDGAQIGPNQGSCGTAAYLGHPVYVTDVTTDPLWKDFRHLALDHGLRACWSTPIEDRAGKVLGTFAVYHRTPRTPTADELQLVREMTQTAAEAIAAARQAEVLRYGLL